MTGKPSHLKLSSVLIYPNTEQVALASLGFLKVFHLLSKATSVADYTYFPFGKTRRVVSPRKGLLVGAVTGRPVGSFDLVAFSLAYENDFVRVPQMLRMAGLEVLSPRRKEVFPFVLFGGFTMASNPLPVADFADAILIGEAEPVINRILSELERAKSDGLARRDVLERLASIDGLFIPEFGNHPVRRVYADLDEIGMPLATGRASHFGGMVLVEVGRGCGRGCLFCSAGSLYRPVRFKPIEDLIAGIAEHAHVGLLGTAVGDHPGLIALLKAVVSGEKTAGLSSLRPDEITPELGELLVRSHIKTIALAPETGSDDLRKRIGKPISRDRIVESVAILADAGLKTIKLYFMIGLPREQQSDVEGIVDLVSEMARVRRRSRLAVTASPFVPKPHTPLQWAGFASDRVIAARLKVLKNINRIRGCSLKPGSIGEAWVEACLSRGERSLAGVLLEIQPFENPRTVLKKSGLIDPTVELDTSKPLPWDFIDNLIPKKRLVEAYESFVRS